MKELTLVSVPIGNLGDITERAREKLSSTRHIISEDTRKTKNLLNALGIKYGEKKIHSYHDHSSIKVIDFVLKLLESEEVVLVSDAGSPAISDPAYPLVDKVLSSNGKVTSCPGPSSLVMALELSGFTPIPSYFHGFISREKGKQKSFFESISKLAGTHVFFESPNRIIDTLELMSRNLKDVRVCLTRELTKLYESVLRFDISQLDQIKKHIVTKGEFVVLVSVPSSQENSFISSSEVRQLAEKVVESKGKKKDLSKLLAKILNRSSKEIYSDLDS